MYVIAQLRGKCPIHHTVADRPATSIANEKVPARDPIFRVVAL